MDPTASRMTTGLSALGTVVFGGTIALGLSPLLGSLPLALATGALSALALSVLVARSRQMVVEERPGLKPRKRS
jgi:predicted exporter